MNTFKKTGGFTLVELIIVIAILAILSSVAVAGYSTYIKRANDSAVLSELNNISTAAVLANAEAGGIKKIEVKQEGTGDDAKLKIVITADSKFASDFATLLNASVKGMSADSDSADNTYTTTMALPASWSASDYADDTIVWEGEWPKAVKAAG